MINQALSSFPLKLRQNISVSERTFPATRIYRTQIIRVNKFEINAGCVVAILKTADVVRSSEGLSNWKMPRQTRHPRASTNTSTSQANSPFLRLLTIVLTFILGLFELKSWAALIEFSSVQLSVHSIIISHKLMCVNFHLLINVYRWSCMFIVQLQLYEHM